MAECPNCKKKLHIWNFKAECPGCGTNIPDFNWEKKLEEEAEIREESYFRLNTKIKRIAFSAVGTPVRVIRLICSFIPIIGYVLPLGSFSITIGSSVFCLENASLLHLILDLIKNKTLDFGGFITLLTTQADIGNSYGLLSLIFYVLSLVIGIIAFFSIPLANKNFRTTLHPVLHIMSTVLFALTPVMFAEFCKASFAPENAIYSGDYGIYIGIALFTLASIFDIIICATPLKENEGRYIPTDELQREYAIKIGAIKENE